MKLKKIIEVLSISFLLIACKDKIEELPNEFSNTYSVDINNNIFQWDNFISNDIEIIQLETSIQSVIGNISKGIVHKDKIYLFDQMNQRLLSFDQKGKFLGKIGIKGRGPEEYREIRDFCIADSLIYILDYRKFHVYNDNEYIQSVNINVDNGFNPMDIIAFNSNEYYLWNSNPDVWDRKKGIYYRLRKIKNSRIIKKYFKYNFNSLDDPRFYSCDSNSYYLKPLDGKYGIYKIFKDSIKPSFKIDFGSLSLTTAEVEELRKSKIPNAYFKSNYFKNISNIFEIKNFIYFLCVGPDSRMYEGLINKKSGKVQFGLRDYKKSPMLFYSDGNYLYGYYEPYILLNFPSESLINRSFEMAAKKINNLTESDNQVIIKFKLKQPHEEKY